MSPQVQFRLSNIVYLQKRVKDYQKPFRFTVTAFWKDGRGRDQGFDIVGCLGGIGRDGTAEWNGPMYWMGRRPAYSVHIAPGTYEDILGALVKGGYFKQELEDLLRDGKEDLKPLSSEDLYGLPGELMV
jgi:hypothetical protein